MTPSQWHDDARNRDAGHDEMQAQVWRWYSNNNRSIFWNDDAPMKWAGATFEHPFIVDGKIVGFGDVVSHHWLDVKSPSGIPKRCNFYRVLEIKPRIDSVGAVIRQCFAMKQIMDALGKSKGWQSQEVRTVLIPVVPYDDPKAALLKEVSPYSPLFWDREVGEPRPL